MKIGLISDTHGCLDLKILDYFQEVDEIWHAGDIGTIDVLENLRSFKPTIAVWGNIDGEELRVECKEIEIFEREGLEILLTHIAAKPPKYNKEILKEVRQHRPKILVCGHSHILKVMPDSENKLLFINPGAAGKHGFHKMKTILRFEIEEKQIKNMEAIELGLRAKI